MEWEEKESKVNKISLVHHLQTKWMKHKLIIITVEWEEKESKVNKISLVHHLQSKWMKDKIDNHHSGMRRERK